MREHMTQLQALYDGYIRQCREINIGSSYGAGLFSSGKDPRNHPCHDAFYEAVGKLVSRWVQDPPADPVQIVRYMLETPYFYANEDACWYLFAVQNHVKPLIPLLSRADRDALADWFSRIAPAKRRVPVQEEILNLLKE